MTCVRRTLLALVCSSVLTAGVSRAQDTRPSGRPDLLSSTDLFVSGAGGVHTYRIPALITAPNGDLLACCDARRANPHDLIGSRDIDIVLRRSKDSGETWSEIEVVCDFGDGRPASDPSLIVDSTTGVVFCFYNVMDQDQAPGEFRLYVQRSADSGASWQDPIDITDDLTPPDWKQDFKFITSGRGIQRSNGDLLHTLVNLKRGVRLFGSRDHGETWFLNDAAISPGDESKVVELSDGALMVNSRVNGKSVRWVHRSHDNGRTWASAADPRLVDPACNASLLRYPSRSDGRKPERLLFCNANSPRGRKNLTLRISYDDGQTWSGGRVIDPGPAAYSSMTVCPDGGIGVLYERGAQGLRFVRVTLSELTDGADRLDGDR